MNDKLDEKIGISTGLNLDLEREQATDTDWVFGALSQPCKINIPVGERKKYLPDGEIQHLGVDKQDCASRGPINILECKFTYGVQNKVFSEENIAWLKQKGYADVNGRVTFSDRWVAIISGTTPQGNSMKAPIDAIHRVGLIPKSMFPQVHSWEEYYDKSKITNGMHALASEFKSRFDIYYEKVYPVHFSDVLKDDIANVAGHAWPRAENGVYPKNTNPINHDFILVEKPDFVAFDNYIDPVDGDFYKQLAADYIFFEWGYRIFIEENSPQKRAYSLADSINDSHQNWSFIRKLADVFTEALLELKKWLDIKAPINEPMEKPVENPIEKPVDKLHEFCMAIQKHEGYYEGSRSFRNRNPGNVKYSIAGYKAEYGIVRRDNDGFAIFETYDIGLLYLKNFIKNIVKGQSKRFPKGGDTNLLEFFQIYAPTADNNNPKQYAEAVSKQIGVPVNNSLKSFIEVV